MLNWDQLKDNLLLVLVIKANFLENLGNFTTSPIPGQVQRRNLDSVANEPNDMEIKSVVQNFGISLDDANILNSQPQKPAPVIYNIREAKLGENKYPCRYMKNIPEFDIRNMLDVWQIAYYKLPKDLSCFKLYIKEITVPEQRRYSEFLGNFNDSVNWKSCILEIQSNGNQKMRMHFLRDTWREKGIFENIIIDEDIGADKKKSYFLNEKTSNQWFAYKNLLLMRDCDTGFVVVFAKVPKRPYRREVEEALVEFGFEEFQELRACEEV